MQNDTLTIPIDFSSEVDPQSVGFKSHKLDQLTRLFETQVIKQHLSPSAQLVVLRFGKVVLDRTVGTNRGRPVTQSTPYLGFSVSKSFTGACIHKLIEEGKINLDAHVADYWPEFGCKGKGAATIRHVFLHREGIPAPRLYSQILTWPSWKLVTRHVALSTAVYPPGEVTAYHMLNYGFIFGEVLRRVTGKDLGTYLQENFLAPLHMENSYLPLPYGLFRQSPRLVTGEFPLTGATFLFNLPIVRHSLIPAATLHSSARDVAIFYQMFLNGGTYAGRQYLKPETVAFATSEGYAGIDHTFKGYERWAYGFHLGGKIQTPEGDKYLGMGKGASQASFGHYGMASTMAFADPKADLVFVYTCNRMIESMKVRNEPLLEALWESIEL